MASDYEKNLAQSEEQTNNTAAARQRAEQRVPMNVPGFNVLGGGDIMSVIAQASAQTAQQGGTKDGGASVMLTRDVIGAKKYETGQTYQTTPRYKPPLSDMGGKQPSRLVHQETAVVRGRIDEANEDYRDYYNGGFINNQNERINDGVILAAGGDFELYEGVFQAAVNEAAVRQSAGERITVEEVLQGWTKNGLPDGLKRGGGGGGGGGSRAFTNIDTRVDLTNEGEARRIVNNALTGALGREATKAENAAFMKALNMYEKENPTVTTSKGVASASGTTSTTTSEGGFDSIDFADRYAKSQEGYAEYQAATTYLDAFINSLESKSRVI